MTKLPPDMQLFPPRQRPINRELSNYADLLEELTTAVTPALKDEIAEALDPKYIDGRWQSADTIFLHFPNYSRKVNVPLGLDALLNGADHSGSKHSPQDLRKAGDAFLRMGICRREKDFLYLGLLFYEFGEDFKTAFTAAGETLLADALRNNCNSNEGYSPCKLAVVAIDNSVEDFPVKILPEFERERDATKTSWYELVGQSGDTEYDGKTLFERVEIWPLAVAPMINAFAYAKAYDSLKDAAVKLVQAGLGHCAIMALAAVKLSSSEAGVEKTATFDNDGGK